LFSLLAAGQTGGLTVLYRSQGLTPMVSRQKGTGADPEYGLRQHNRWTYPYIKERKSEGGESGRACRPAVLGSEDAGAGGGHR